MTDTKEIEAADDAFFAALRSMFSGDIAPMEALWSHADDVIYLGPIPDLFHIGWRVTDSDWSGQAQAHLGGDIRVIERHIVAGAEIATTHHVAEASGQGPDATSVRMRGTNVFRLEGGEWKMIAHHSDPLPYLVT